MHDVKRVAPLVALGPAGVGAGPAAVGEPRLHEARLVVEDRPVRLRAGEVKVGRGSVAGRARDDRRAVVVVCVGERARAGLGVLEEAEG